MIEHALRLCKKLVRAPGVRPVLNATGLVSAGRKAYERRILEAGEHHATFLGERLRFSVVAQQEIVRLDAEFSEAEFLGRFLESIRPGDIVFDIGANIGIWSLAAGSRYRDAGITIRAFEPDPTNFRQLSRNFELNGMRAFAAAEPVALGDAPGEAQLFLGGEAGTGNHTLSADRARSGEMVRVRVERADQYCERVSLTPSVVKIDVEGFELSVLRGMTALLERGGPREMFIEVHTGGAAPVSEEDVNALLSPHGYEVAWRRQRVNEMHLHLVSGG